MMATASDGILWISAEGASEYLLRRSLAVARQAFDDVGTTPERSMELAATLEVWDVDYSPYIENGVVIEPETPWNFSEADWAHFFAFDEAQKRAAEILGSDAETVELWPAGAMPEAKRFVKPPPTGPHYDFA